MGNCIYCGKKAGLFKDHHKECVEKRDSGRIQLQTAVVDAITKQQNFEYLSPFLDAIAKECFIGSNEKQSLIFKGYDQAVAKLCHGEQLMSKEDEEKVVVFQNHFNYTQEQLNRNHSFDLVAKSSIIRRLAAGEDVSIGVPDGFVLPIIMEKGENLLWAFGASEFYQPSTKTVYANHSSGVSVRVTKGLYYRMGASRGEPITTTEMKLLATGVTFYTTRNIYFSSPMKGFKIPYKKIISLFPYQNGISVQKDGASSKPFILKNVDGGFLQNIIANALDH
jgi:hypothetical protein